MSCFLLASDTPATREANKPAFPSSGLYVRSHHLGDSSRLVILTTYQSWMSRVKLAAQSKSYSYSETNKGARMKSSTFNKITLGVTIIDKAHTCFSPDTTYHNTLRQIELTTQYTVKKIFLIWIIIRKTPGNLITMIGALKSKEQSQLDHPFYPLPSLKLEALTTMFAGVKSVNDQALRDTVKKLAPLLPLVMIRRTNDSGRFGLPLRSLLGRDFRPSGRTELQIISWSKYYLRLFGQLAPQDHFHLRHYSAFEDRLDLEKRLNILAAVLDLYLNMHSQKYQRHGKLFDLVLYAGSPTLRGLRRMHKDT